MGGAGAGRQDEAVQAVQHLSRTGVMMSCMMSSVAISNGFMLDISRRPMTGGFMQFKGTGLGWNGMEWNGMEGHQPDIGGA